MSALTNKYQSYDHFKGISFDESTFTASPAETGTRDFAGYPNVSSLTFTSDGANNPTIQTGPMSNQKYYEFEFDSTTTPTKHARLIYGSTATTNAGNLDDPRRTMWDSTPFDRVVGFWMKMPSQFGIDNANVALHRWLYGTQAIINVGPGKSSGAPALAVVHGTNEIITSSTTLYSSYTDQNNNVIPIEWDKWYFIAVRKTVVENSPGFNNGETASGTLVYEHYINGELVGTISRTTWTKRSINAITFGNNAAPAGLGNCKVGFSSWFVTDWSQVGQTQLREIYNSSIEINKVIDANAMTADATKPESSVSGSVNFIQTSQIASALILHPTIIVTSPNHTEITTSILVSAEFPSNIAISASQNININITEILTASAELINNVEVNTPISVSISSSEFIASALMNKATVSENPFIASALMNHPSIFVTPSYYKMIIEDNPLYYWNYDTTTGSNYGSWGTVSYTDISSNVQKAIPSTENMGLVGNGKSWYFTDSGTESHIKIIPTDAVNKINTLCSDDFSIEFWAKGDFLKQFRIQVGNITIGSFEVQIRSLWLPTYYQSDYLHIEYLDNYIENNDWNHFVVTGQKIDTDGSGQPISPTNDYYGFSGYNWDFKVWTNASLAGSVQRKIRDLSVYPDLNYDNLFISAEKVNTPNYQTNRGNFYFDEVAIYNRVLSNSEIIDHHSYINNLNPNPNYYSNPMSAISESGNHQFTVTSNVNVAVTPITGSADFAMPSVLAVKNINYSAQIMIATALNTDVTVYYGRTMIATPLIASAYKPESYRLSNIYYNYVQTNITPYRYVNFDHANPYLDFGTDADYAVIPTAVGGNIVNPDLGINGKSAKTAGSSYITDGVILKESEHDDNWGTGNNSWHSSFWMEQSPEDNSTGLRILWNLNGAYDNQNIILYHYQNKLHLQINNQVGTPITITSANNVNLFNLTRHHIVINSHHNNNNNHLYVYVDAVLILDQNIGSYAVTTINNPIHVGANDEANNFARLGVGCLITPFAYTALPVVPTNTRLIIDEIHWDKEQILQTMVNNIYNIMPDKDNSNIAVDPFLASNDFLMPAISTNIVYYANAMTASAQLVNPNLYIERFIINAAEPMTASALMTPALAFQNAIINSDVMAAGAIFNSAGVIISIPGPTMYAGAEVIDRVGHVWPDNNAYGLTQKIGIKVNNKNTYQVLSPWATWLRLSNTNSILATKELV